MRRRIVAMVVAGVSAVCLVQGSAAGKGGSRVVLEPYSPLNISRWHLSIGDPGASLAEVRFQPKPGERSISVVLQDESGLPARGNIEQEGQWSGPFCGQTEEPVAIDPAKELYVVVYSGGCGGSAAAATEGTMEVTFYRGGRR